PVLQIVEVGIFPEVFRKSPLNQSFIFGESPVGFLSCGNQIRIVFPAEYITQAVAPFLLYPVNQSAAGDREVQPADKILSGLDANRPLVLDNVEVINQCQQRDDGA